MQKNVPAPHIIQGILIKDLTGFYINEHSALPISF